MARVETIVVGGGVGAIAPFTEGALAVIISDDPAAITASVATQTATGDIVIGTDPDATATETLRLRGGAIFEGNNTTTGVRETDSVSIGRNQTWSGVATDSICIGRETSIGAHTLGVLIGAASSIATVGGGGNVVVGAQSSITTGSNNVLIGSSTTVSQTGCTAVGQGVTVTGAGGTAVGASAQATGNSGTALGNSCRGNNTDAIAVGVSANVTHTFAAVIGRGTSIGNNTVLIGNNNSGSVGYTTLVFGEGDTRSGTSGAASARTIRFTNMSGGTNNVTAGDLTIIAPLGSGTATPAAINLQTGIVGGAGNTTQVPRTGLKVQSSALAGDTDIMVWDVNSGALARVSVGAVDSGGAGFKVLRVPN